LDDLDRLERRLIRAHEVGDLQSTVGDRVLARLADIRRMVRKLVRSLEEARQRRSGVWSGDSG